MLLPIKGCGGGVNKDALPSELAAGVWSDASNVEFSDGFARQRKGIQSVYTTPTETPYFLLTFNTTTTRYLIEASTAKVFADDGSARTEITNASPFTGARDDRWTGGDYNGVLVLNNGVDEPQYWNGNTATDLADLTSWPAGYLAKVCRPFKNFLTFGAITKAGTMYPGLFLWSTSADPGSIPTAYTSTATNDAGEQPLQGIGQIIDMLPLGDMLIVYGQTGRYAVQYIGGNEVFSFMRLPGEEGIKAANCVVATPKGHVFLSNGDVLLHNGDNCTSIAQGRVREWIFSTMDATNAARSFVTMNPQRSTVWICFPSAGSTDCNKVAIWNWNTDTWAIYDIANLTAGCHGLVSSAILGGTWAADSASWASDTTSWDQDEFNANEARLVLATSTPRIGLANTGTTDFGSTFTYYAERTGIRPSDENMKFFVRRSQWDWDGTDGTTVTVYHGMSNTADGTPTYVSGTHTQGTSDWVNAMCRRGRYAAIKFSGTSGPQLSLRTVRLDLRGCGQE